MVESQGRFVWYELITTETEAAKSFYTNVVGWDTGEVSMMRFSAGGQTIGGMATKPPKVRVPFWLYYFNIGDIDAAAKRVKVGGGQILNGPVEVPGGSWIVHCTDPQGAIFALMGKRRYKAMVFFEPPESRDVLSWRKRSVE